MKHRNYSIKRMARRKTSDETSQNETGRREHRFEWAIFVSTHVRSIEARWTPPRNGCWFGGQSVIRRSASMASTASIHLGETAAWRWPCTRRPWHGIPARKSHWTPLAAGRSETRADKKLGTKLGKGAGGAARGRWARRPKTKQSAESIALWPVRRQLTAAASAINTTDTHALALAHTHTHTHTHAHSHTHTRARWHSRGSSSSSSNAFTRILVILLESKIAVWSEWGREVVPGGGGHQRVSRRTGANHLAQTHTDTLTALVLCWYRFFRCCFWYPFPCWVFCYDVDDVVTVVRSGSQLPGDWPDPVDVPRRLQIANEGMRQGRGWGGGGGGGATTSSFL